MKSKCELRRFLQKTLIFVRKPFSGNGSQSFQQSASDVAANADVSLLEGEVEEYLVQIRFRGPAPVISKLLERGQNDLGKKIILSFEKLKDLKVCVKID